MSSGKKIGAAAAYIAASDVAEALFDACEVIKLAGSLRRYEEEVGDIELVAIPRYEERATGDLFRTTTRVNLLEERVARVLAAGAVWGGRPIARHPTDPRDGPKYKKLWLPDPGISVDLFITIEPAQFAVLHLIRTGPAEFSKAMVTKLIPRGLRCEGGAIRRGAEIVPCPDEKTFFALVGMPYLPPEARAA